MSVFVRTLWLCGAAVSLSRRRSLRRGTPGHDGFPRALGIMPLRHLFTSGWGHAREEALQSKDWGASLFIRQKNKSEKPHVFREATMIVAFRNTCGFSAV